MKTHHREVITQPPVGAKATETELEEGKEEEKEEGKEEEKEEGKTEGMDHE